MLVSGLLPVALFLYAATGVRGFVVSTSTPDVRAKENEGADLKCTYSGDFGAGARVEWKFNDLKGSQAYVVFDGKPTSPYSTRVTMYGTNIRFTKLTRDDNGVYDCEVSGNGQFGEARVKLTVEVPPSAPLCRIPSSVTTGKKAMLTCHDSAGSPPPQYRWFKDSTLLPPEPQKIAAFKNYTYLLNTDDGSLEFARAAKMDSGTYFCEAFNNVGAPQRCKAVKMEVRDLNTGGIVAGVIIFLLLLALLGFGIWYAHKKGYLPKKSESKPKPNVVYQPPSLYGGEEEDRDFKQKSSFVV
ncbi:F11 receptor, tandem duplicate 1 [Platichthys flesus]|uniref:F11 receptor, tandem duplicate 1 n=1 Tax=Platichthys flesus TaxID=8260 RepID=UPI002DB61E7B|nr:F11 receptor, tandem duplicate 1 [Platichthys flesus]